jgi:hypothetical protein
MRIRAGYEISYDCPQPTPMILESICSAAAIARPTAYRIRHGRCACSEPIRTGISRPLSGARDRRTAYTYIAMG